MDLDFNSISMKAFVFFISQHSEECRFIRGGNFRSTGLHGRRQDDEIRQNTVEI